MAATSYKIRNIAPPDLAGQPEAVRRMFWGWVVQIGLKEKDKELAKGLDKDGRPLRPITAKTRKYRRSAMTPSGKGDPNAPPLMPAYQLSRTRSLLAGRALSTHAEFFWRFDPFTGDSWGYILAIHAKKGRDVIGLSAEATRRVQTQAWALWASWKAGRAVPPVQPTRRHHVPPVKDHGRRPTKDAVGLNGDAGKAGDGLSNGLTYPEWRRHFLAPLRPRRGPLNRLLSFLGGSRAPRG